LTTMPRGRNICLGSPDHPMVAVEKGQVFKKPKSLRGDD
jgi:hypothetical protein